jgi:predicted metal-dependent phosphoesterase TrpH
LQGRTIRIDLHTHTNASDGTDTPAQLVAVAVAAGLDVLAITDHDTTRGWDEALAARPEALTIVAGAEFSCVHHGSDGTRISLHLLGYLFDAEHPGLRAERARLRDSRLTRGRAIVDNLVEDGYPITWEQVSDLADGGSVGRPHIGRALMAAGVVPDVSTAFATMLSSRAQYHVRKADIDVFEAIALLRAAGGLPVFAHPLARRRGPVVDDDVIAAMTAAGLVGIEVEHPDHDAADRAHAAGLARELGLIPTGSSDYHGTNKATQIGACTTDPAAYEQLMALPSARRPIGAHQ